MLVKLLIRAAPGTTFPTAGTLSVELRDTTELDAPATIVAAVRIPGVPPDQQGLLAEVTLAIPEERLRGRSVDAYARLGAPTGQPPQVGDLVTMQSFPVTDTGPLELVLSPVN